jgi:serine protease Do
MTTLWTHSQNAAAMAGHDTIDTDIRPRAARPTTSAARQPQRSPRAEMLRRALAPATLLGAIGIAVALLGFGEPVPTVGSSPRFGDTVINGVIATLKHAASIAVDPDHLLNSVQTDAGANPGSSGGALTNMYGKPSGVTPVMPRLGAAGHIQDGAFRQYGAESAMQPVVCVRGVCNPKE